MSTPALQQLREILKQSDDDSLQKFLQGYSIGMAADVFVASMTAPNQRIAFFTALAQTYPDDWAQAVTELSKL